MIEQRRFYLMSNGWSVNPSDFDLKNEKSLFETLAPDNRTKYWVEGYDHPVKFGLHNFTQTPLIKVAIKNKPLDLYGMQPWYVSTSAKDLLSTIDPKGFEFLRCETHSPPRHEVDDYWMMNVRRVVEEFDEENSVFERPDAVELTTGESHYNPFIGRLYELKVPTLSEDAHAFWLKCARSYPIFDGDLVDEIRNSKLSGFRFTPLQRPTKAEMKDSVKDVTFPYWLDKVSS